MRLYLGFYLLNFRGDSAGAAEQFALAAPIPGAPPYLKRFAAKLLTLSGEVDRAKLFTEHMLSVTEDPEEKAKLEKRLREIEVEGAFREVEAAAVRFRSAEGRWPTGLDELGRFTALPTLPAGASLKDGAISAPDLERLTVYEHPKEGPIRAAP